MCPQRCKTGYTHMSSTKMNSRVDFGKIKHLAETPDLLEVQVQSFKEFFHALERIFQLSFQVRILKKKMVF